MAERPKWFSRLMGSPRPLPRVPEGIRVYAVGDIHGRYDLLEKLLQLIREDAAQTSKRNTLVFLGDYVDRGPRSRDVVECVMALAWPGWDIVALRGNHEEIMLEFCGNADVYRTWRDFGGADTLLSYGVRPPSFDDRAEFARAREEFVRKVPARHVEYLRSLPLSHTVGDYHFVHAGVRPSVALDQQSPQDLLWIRDEFLFSDRALDKVIVHGHSPTGRPVVRPNRIGVDTGAYATNCLTAAILDGESCTFLGTVGVRNAG